MVIVSHLLTATPLASPSVALLVAAATATLVAAATLAVATSVATTLASSVAPVLSIRGCKMQRFNFYTLLQKSL